MDAERAPARLRRERCWVWSASCSGEFNAFVTLASHVRSFTSSNNSDAAKYLTLCGGGLPSGLAGASFQGMDEWAGCFACSAFQPRAVTRLLLARV